MLNYQDTMVLMRARYSCRGYDADRQVTPEQVAQVIEAARIAPSACNRQPWRFVVVRDPQRRAAMLAKSRPAFLEAPVLIVACGLTDQAWVRPADHKNHTHVDLSIAVEHMCLAATALGLATCWVCSFDVDAVRRELCLPDGVEPVAILPLGYAAKDHDVAPEKIRKPIDEICSCETF